MSEPKYDFLLKSLSGPSWKRIGIRRRAGVVAPLFSVYSSRSIGIGELPDLKLLVDWCKTTGMSIIQFLPMNDVGFNFRPYDAQSSFALDPLYLSLQDLASVDPHFFQQDLRKLKHSFPVGGKRVNYRVKAAKLEILRKMFSARSWGDVSAFQAFIQENYFWLADYALFKVIKEKNNDMTWEGWSEDLKHKHPEAIASFSEIYREQILFQQWLQWQLFEQFRDVKAYAHSQEILFMGDLPFLVSRDSADVWSHQDYFKLNLSAGAPPDMLYSLGQRWGMPPYQWDNISKHNHDYLLEKLRYAANFYDLYRVDHVVGIFRVWTIPLSESLEHAGLRGAFDPEDKNLWESHGRNLLSLMVGNSPMLACAEDLGTIPPCTFKVLEELGIPGIEVQRWMRDWNHSQDFKQPSDYRKNAVATIGTHDMSSLCAWWQYEAGTVDENLFRRKCKEKNISFDVIKERLFDLRHSHCGRLRWNKEIKDKSILARALGLPEESLKELMDLYAGSFDEQEKFLKFLNLPTQDSNPPQDYQFIKHALEKISDSASIFSIQLLHDWLSMDSLFDCDPADLRINAPGTLSDKNWSLVIPLSLEDLCDLPMNQIIRSINEHTLRA